MQAEQSAVDLAVLLLILATFLAVIVNSCVCGAVLTVWTSMRLVLCSLCDRSSVRPSSHLRHVAASSDLHIVREDTYARPRSPQRARASSKSPERRGSTALDAGNFSVRGAVPSRRVSPNRRTRASAPKRQPSPLKETQARVRELEDEVVAVSQQRDFQQIEIDQLTTRMQSMEKTMANDGKVFNSQKVLDAMKKIAAEESPELENTVEQHNRHA